MSELKGIKGLAEKFTIEEVRFLPSHSNKNGIILVPYIEKYDVYNRLNNCLGPENWSTKQEHLSGGYVKCSLTILDPHSGREISRDGIGMGDAGDLKAADTDSVKRAATAFGIGNFPLKVLWPSVALDKNNKKVPTWQGKWLYGHELTKHARSVLSTMNVSPHQEDMVWLNFDKPATQSQQTRASQQSSSPTPSTTPEPAKTSAYNEAIVLEMIRVSDTLPAFKTSVDVMGMVPGDDTKMKAEWGDKIVAFADGRSKKDILAIGKLVNDVFGKENGYASVLRGYYNEAE